VLISKFDRPAYAIPPGRRVPDGVPVLRDYVVVTHPTHRHIIDNKLMDLVRGALVGVGCWWPVCVCRLDWSVALPPLPSASCVPLYTHPHTHTSTMVPLLLFTPCRQSTRQRWCALTRHAAAKQHGAECPTLARSSTSAVAAGSWGEERCTRATHLAGAAHVTYVTAPVLALCIVQLPSLRPLLLARTELHRAACSAARRPGRTSEITPTNKTLAHVVCTVRRPPRLGTSGQQGEQQLREQLATCRVRLCGTLARAAATTVAAAAAAGFLPSCWQCLHQSKVEHQPHHTPSSASASSVHDVVFYCHLASCRLAYSSSRLRWPLLRGSWTS
jgi:hypothetical protein